MIELIRHAHHARLHSAVIWGLAIGVTSALMLVTFTAFDASQMTDITKSLSPEMQKIFGFTSSSLSTPQGYLSVEVLGYLPLALGFFTITAGTRAVAGSEHDRSLDLVLGQPLPRWNIPVAALLASVLGLLEILAIYVAAAWLTALAIGVGLPLGDLLISALGLIPIVALYGGLALMLSAMLRRPGTVTALCGGLLVLGYLANAIAVVVPEVEWLRWLTPFHYYGAPITDGLDLSDQAVLLGGAVVLTLASLPLVARRDVRA